MNTVIKVENLSKQYRLGKIGTGTLSHDLNRWWAKVRGKGDPYLKIGSVNRRDEKGDSDYVWALRDINFEVKQGEVLGIIGKNGAGKSTLLKILSRVTAPTTGELKAKGRIASLLEVGTGFHPELSGKENIFLNGAILGMTKREIKSKYDEIVNFSGVERYIDTPVKRYSSGMYVRLAFAVAAHLEPEILIIDEVLAVGDAEFQKKCMGKMKDVSGQGRTVLLVSHNMLTIRNLCKRALLLEHGCIIKDGQTEEVMDKYFSQLFTDSRKFLKELPPHGSGKARLTNIEAFNDNGEKTFEIPIGSNISFKIEVEVLQKIPDLKCRIEIRSPFNVKELIAASEKYDINFAGNTPIIFEIRAQNLNLKQGEYPLVFWLGSEYESPYDHVFDKTPPLSILPLDEGSETGEGGIIPLNCIFTQGKKAV